VIFAGPFARLSLRVALTLLIFLFGRLVFMSSDVTAEFKVEKKRDKTVVKQVEVYFWYFEIMNSLDTLGATTLF
jgi:phosphate starvation-inducible membrane PsiE